MTPWRLSTPSPPAWVSSRPAYTTIFDTHSVALEDLSRDGDHKVRALSLAWGQDMYMHPSLLQFLVGDLGNGQLDMKLKVYKGTLRYLPLWSSCYRIHLFRHRAIL